MAIFTLKDAASDCLAQIDVGKGFNCFSWQALAPEGPREMLWRDPGFPYGEARPSSSGIPILFPFPGRIRSGMLHYQGKDYQLPLNDRLGNAIHGFVYTRQWRIIHESRSGSGVYAVTGEFQASVDDPSLLDFWPADFRITVQISLHSKSLAYKIEVENVDGRSLPFGLGLHPYFRWNLENAKLLRSVSVPVAESWVLEGLVPTGKRANVSADHPLLSGTELNDVSLDDVFSVSPDALADDAGWWSTIQNGKQTVEMLAGSEFPYAVVYSPPHKEAICVEPYSCTPDAWGGPNRGARHLEAGESMSTNVLLRAKFS